MNKELTPFIIKQLCRCPRRDEVVRKVCKKGGFAWKDAERLVILVEAQHKREITEYRSQSPVLLLVSVATLLLGVGLLIYNTQALWAISSNEVIREILGLRANAYQLVELGGGLGLTLGGAIGLWKALGSIFPE
jgi:hypothetical protein